MTERQTGTPSAWMISPRFNPIPTMHAFGVDDDGSLIQIRFTVLFLEWVASAKCYWVTLA
jgi:hypothetical protein